MKNRYNIFDGDKKFHGDGHDLWSRCIYLGSHICNGCEYDLGVYEGSDLDEVSFVIVYGKKWHQYIAGFIGRKDEGLAMIQPMNSIQLRNAGPHDSYYEHKCPLQMETLTRYRRYLSAQRHNKNDSYDTPNYYSNPSY